MRFHEIEIEFEDSSKNFRIFTNLPIEGDINTINALIDNWRARTEDYSKKSLIDYFMSKKSMMPEYYMFSTAKQVKKHFSFLEVAQ